MPGFALLESSLALFLLAASVLVWSDLWLKSVQVSEVVLAQNALVEMRSILAANPRAAQEGAYQTDGLAVTIGTLIPSCRLFCSSAQLAQSQVLRWQSQLAMQLPDGRGRIENTVQGQRISVRWHSAMNTPDSLLRCGDSEALQNCVSLEAHN